MKIVVSTDDIRDGVPEDSYHCPIALAIRRVLPRPERPEQVACVLDNRVAIAGLANDVPLPENARKFIVRFDTPDSRSDCCDFEFELPISFDDDGNLVSDL